MTRLAVVPGPFTRRRLTVSVARFGVTVPVRGNGDADLLSVRELEVVAVGIGDDRPVADRRPLVVRPTHGATLLERVGDAAVDLVAALDSDAEMSPAAEHVGDVGLQQDDDK